MTSIFKSLKKRFFASNLIAYLLYICIRILFASYRLRFVPSATVPSYSPQTSNGIFYFWHQDIISGMYFFFMTHSTGHCVVSPSSDGKIVGRICTQLGFTVLYGSAFKSPTTLLKNCLLALKNNGRLCLVGDGSRGPARVLQPGLPFLAEKTQTPIIFVSCTPSRSITNKKSWDNFRVPLPFSIVTISLERQEALPNQTA